MHVLVKTKSGCKFGEKCSYAHRQVDEQPSIRSKKNDDKSAVAVLKITRQLGCVFQDTRLGRKLSLNCLFARRNNNNFDLCRPPGN